jgi:hypothetical protein
MKTKKILKNFKKKLDASDNAFYILQNVKYIIRPQSASGETSPTSGRKILRAAIKATAAMKAASGDEHN